MKRTLLPWLQLLRLPAVFSALADIFAGWLVAHGSIDDGVRFGLLLGASASLYLAGMVFNDVFDRDVDAKERPERPIPSGRVSVRSAFRLGAVLVVLGNVLAACAGIPSLVVALCLTVCIFAYDGLLKNTLVGPVAMGACRSLNVLLGASVAGNLAGIPLLHVAVALGIYIAGVTLFARNEAGVSGRMPLVVAIGVVNLGLALLVAWFLNVSGPKAGQTAIIVLAVIVLTVDRRMVSALFEPTSARVQASVRMLLMSYITLDAAIVMHATANVPYTLGVLALLLPAVLLGRWMSIT
ncbi:MAG TPA: UbiA family prenyltransferase [Planctomycetaceae bacterium]|nr:UbiA family prenyltransferase [Planctomycetaceae bacterium]